MSTPIPEQHYFMRPRKILVRVAMMLSGMMILPLLMPFYGEEIDGHLIALMAVFMVGFALLIASLSRLHRLVVTPHGVEFRTPGMKIATTWDNIASIGYQIIRGEGRVEGLYLQQTGMDVNPLVRAGSVLNYRMPRSFDDYEHFLPVSNILGKDWRDTSFGEILRRHAPHLFEDKRA